MLAVITGGSGSGKSAYAEQLAVSYSGGGRRIYLASMSGGGDTETEARIARHRKQRAGLGFETVEQPRDAGSLAFSGKDTILLEDLSNLLANELYMPGTALRAEKAVEKITCELLEISRAGNCLIVVVSQIGADIPSMSPEVRDFVRMQEEITVRLASEAEYVAEVSAGIPFVLKGRWIDG